MRMKNRRDLNLGEVVYISKTVADILASGFSSRSLKAVNVPDVQSIGACTNYCPGRDFCPRTVPGNVNIPHSIMLM